MASSAALTTTHLPALRKFLHEWQAKQPVPTDFASFVDGAARGEGTLDKDVLVCFRTRPPLPDEVKSKFTASVERTSDLEVEFCAGISVPSAEPGRFIAHIPGMKVSFQSIGIDRYAEESAVEWADLSTQDLRC